MERILRKKLKDGVFGKVDRTRSRTMSHIKSKGNGTTENKLRFALVGAGVRGWKLHCRAIFGTPDFYFHRQKVAIFVDGCFWHGCLKCGHIPKTRKAFWAAKFKRNQQRSSSVKRTLAQKGIRILRFWEHDLKEPKELVERVNQILKSRSRKRH